MNNIKLFQDKKIRSVWNEEEEQWYFSVVDVVEARDHKVLVVAHQRGGVGQLATDPQHAHRVGAAVDHVTEAEEAVVGRRRDALECPLEGRPMAVDVREDVCGHVAILLARRSAAKPHSS